MKIRTDFVTNSSSASYIAGYTLESEEGSKASFGVTARGGELSYNGSEHHRDLLDHIHTASLFVPGLPFRRLPEGMSLDKLTRQLIGWIELKPDKELRLYDPFLSSGPRFLIVGEPQVYGSREELEEAIGYVGKVVTRPLDADFVIYCKKPWRGSEPSFSEEQKRVEAHAMVEASRDIREALEDAGLKLADPDIEYLGDGVDWRVDVTRVGGWHDRDALWKLYTDLEGMDPWEPYVISETDFAFFDPCGPAGSGTLSLMPGAFQAFRTSCAENGVTMENLRFVRLHTLIMSFGDSAWDVDDCKDDWCLDVREGTVEERHNVIRRAGE